MAMHGEHMEAQPPMGLEGDSGEGGVRSYQATSDAQGEVGQSMRCRVRHGTPFGRGEPPMRLTGLHGFHGGMAQLHHHGKA